MCVRVRIYFTSIHKFCVDTYWMHNICVLYLYNKYIMQVSMQHAHIARPCKYNGAILPELSSSSSSSALSFFYFGNNINKIHVLHHSYILDMYRIIHHFVWIEYSPIDVYTMLSGYELYDSADPIGGGEWLDKYGGVLPFACMYDARPLWGEAPSSKPIVTVL